MPPIANNSNQPDFRPWFLLYFETNRGQRVTLDAHLGSHTAKVNTTGPDQQCLVPWDYKIWQDLLDRSSSGFCSNHNIPMLVIRGDNLARGETICGRVREPCDCLWLAVWDLLWSGLPIGDGEFLSWGRGMSDCIASWIYQSWSLIVRCPLKNENYPRSCEGSIVIEYHLICFNSDSMVGIFSPWAILYAIRSGTSGRPSFVCW